MRCQECSEEMVESNKNHTEMDDRGYTTRYYCFECEILYECKSISGDMVEDNLEVLEGK